MYDAAEQSKLLSHHGQESILKYSINLADCPIEASPAFPSGFCAKRPLLQVSITTPQQPVKCLAIVDSGADWTMFPKSFLSQVDPTGSRGLAAKTVGFGGMLETVYLDTEIEFPELNLKTKIRAGYSDSLNGLGVGFLGMDGFFTAVKSVLIRAADGVFEIET